MPPKKQECKTNSKCYIETKGIDEKEFKVPVTLSDETPVDRYNYEYGKFTMILGHSEENVDLSRKDVLGVFWNHNDHSLPLGTYEDVRLEDGKLKAVAVFDEDDEFAMKVFNKAKKGIVKTLSVGVDILEKTITKDENENVTLTVTKWRPYEGSFTANPANENATVGLSNQTKTGEEPMAVKKDVLEFIASANDADKQELSSALGLGDTVALSKNLQEKTNEVASLQEKLSKVDGDGADMMKNAKSSMTEALSMITDPTFDAISAEDKKEAMDSVTLSNDGTVNLDKLEIALLKKVTTQSAPQGGNDNSDEDEVSDEVKNAGGIF